MFWRLFGLYSLLLAISLGWLGWTLLRRMEAHLLGEVRQSLEKMALLVSDSVAERSLSPSDRQQKVRKLAEESHSRITLVAGDGLVLADSAEDDPQRMENHLDRPEIQQAKATGTGAATRFSSTVRERMMYVVCRSDVEPVRYVRLAMPLRAVQQEIGWLRGIVWTAAGVTLALGLLVSVVLSRRISAPLVELTQVARSMAQGACGKQVTVWSQDEAGVLAAAFNEMSQACAAHVDQMDRDRQQLLAVFGSMVEGILVLDAEERVQLLNKAAAELLGVPVDSAHGRKLWKLVRNRQLSQAVEAILASEEPYHCELEGIAADRKILAVHGSRLPGDPPRGAVLVLHDVTHLRKLERVRQDFVANVSHELKTPLAAIQATAETLLDGALHDVDHNVRFLESIRENADRLHRLVQDLLTLGRIESGQEAMALERIPLQGVVEACIARVQQRAAAKPLRLEQQPPDEAVTVLADDEALAEILDNLLDNAIKYTPGDGQVTVRWFTEGRDAVLQVEDTGIGIPEKDLSRVFERFYRVDKARSRELGGTGLGLSIVKHLAQALGGSVSAMSQLGVGSTFTIRLPCVSSPAGQGPVESSEQNAIESASNLHQIYTDGP
jgi:two-component system phosphate regulon sensor histidine kinase PhoR